MIKLEIISAETKRAELEAICEAKEIKRQAEEAERIAGHGQRVETLTENIFNLAKWEIEKAEIGQCEAVITEKNLHEWKFWNNDELNEAINNVITLLTLAGYKCNSFHEYSKSWRTRSGKYGYLFIHID